MNDKIYTMGSADPKPFSFNSMSGADIKIYRSINKNVSAKDMVNGKKIDPKDWFCDTCVVSIEYSTEAQHAAPDPSLIGKCSGTLIKVVFDQQQQFSGPADILMVASNEYGAQSRSALLGVQEVSRHIAMSIDDPVIEETVGIWFDSVILWTQVKKIIKKEEELDQ